MSRQRAVWLMRSSNVLADRTLCRQLAGDLAARECYGGKRAAELVGGRGGECSEGGQALLAGQRQLDRGQGLRQAARLLGDAPHIGGDEEGAEQQCHPDAGDIDERRLERAVGPRQRQVHRGEERDAAGGKQPQPDRADARQHGRRDDHRRQDEHGKGIDEPAREIEQH